jgi:hypothetical protein
MKWQLRKLIEGEEPGTLAEGTWNKAADLPCPTPETWDLQTSNPMRGSGINTFLHLEEGF